MEWIQSDCLGVSSNRARGAYNYTLREVRVLHCVLAVVAILALCHHCAHLIEIDMKWVSDQCKVNARSISDQAFSHSGTPVPTLDIRRL